MRRFPFFALGHKRYRVSYDLILKIKHIYHNLTFYFVVSASDLESIRALFNEKEKELTMAVAKVDELTRQLEDVHNGRGHAQPTSPASIELDKLRAELLVSRVYYL